MKTSRKVGRPCTGKKGYLIRMSPEAKARLDHQIKRHGFSNLGAWLEVASGGAMEKVVNDDDDLDTVELAKGFVAHCRLIESQLCNLIEIIDYSPEPTPEVLEVLQKTISLMDRLISASKDWRDSAA